jgi:hypothetical protein
MKRKGLIFVSCLAAGALVSSPAVAKPTKKSKSNRTTPQTTQVTRNNQNISPRTVSTRYYNGSRFSGTRSYSGRQYTGTRYYRGARYYNNYYGAGGRYYYGGGSYPYYSYYTGWPSSSWGYGTSWGTTRTRITAVIRKVVITTTIRTIRQPPAITRQWLQLCSGGFANSVTTTA